MSEILSFENVRFTYTVDDEQSRPAVNNVTFSVQQGEWLSIVGHNGSGKSTIAKLICGLLAPNSGTISFEQQPLTEDTIWAIRANIGIVFQNPDNQFVGATVQDDVAFSLENIGVPHKEMVARVHKALKQVNMETYFNHEPHHLSGGQKQRVAIAGAIAMEPKLLILDEATSMLDPEGKKEVLEIVKKLNHELGVTVISITHDLEEATGADRILFMNKGEKYKEGTPTEIFALQEVLVENGLDLPFAMRMTKLLKAEGVHLAAWNMTEEELVNDIWTSNFNK